MLKAEAPRIDVFGPVTVDEDDLARRATPSQTRGSGRPGADDADCHPIILALPCTAWYGPVPRVICPGALLERFYTTRTSAATELATCRQTLPTLVAGEERVTLTCLPTTTSDGRTDST